MSPDLPGFSPPVLPPFPLRARRLVDGVHLGSHRSRIRGEGAEFAEYRPYRQGDPLRNVDWRVYARTDRLYVRLREQEVSRRVSIVIDDSRSMDFGSPETKLQRAALAAATLALLCERTGDSYGIDALHSGSSLPCRRGPAHRIAIMKTLEYLGSSKSANAADELALAGAVERRNRDGRGGRLLILCSDFLCSLDDLARALRNWSGRGGDLIACHFIDRAELDLDGHGMMRYRDPETGDEMDTRPDEIRDEYLRALYLHIDRVRRIIQERGGDHRLIRSTEDLRGVLIELQRRRARARASA